MSARKFPYLFAGEQELDCALALCRLKERFHIDRLFAGGGAVMNASLLQNGLIDELSVLVAPVVDGGDGAPPFRRGGILPSAVSVAFKRKDVKRLEVDGLWLRYLRFASARYEQPRREQAPNPGFQAGCHPCQCGRFSETAGHRSHRPLSA